MKHQAIRPGQAADHATVRRLFDDYLRMYLSRDDRLIDWFSEDFSGFTGGGDFLVKDKAAWIAITRQDFAQIKDPIRIELKDVAIQTLADTVAVATGFFRIHLPIKDHILSRETARLVIIFRKESAGWKISHSSISIPYPLVREGEVYPLKELVERNQSMEELIVERTAQLSVMNDNLRQTNEELAREIAERKQAEDALQRSEELYRSILNASPDDITITDMRGHILMVSPAALSMFGFDLEEEGRGQLLTDFIVPEDRERASAQIALKCRGVITGPNEYRGLRHDGSTFDIEANSEFIRNHEGTPTGMVFIVRNITERKHAEAEREKLEAQNRQLQKSESLGRMAGAVAHHFNNQLQAVMMNLEVAMDGLPRNAASFEGLSGAMQSARKAAEVSSLMLTYLGLTVAKREPLDLSSVCRQSLALLRAVKPQGVVLDTDFTLPGPVVLADTNQIQHILTNLVTNAWEASGVAGSVIRLTVKSVAAAEIPATHRFPVDCRPKATTYACLEVADAGCGIPDSEIEKIFDPFFSSKFSGRGMGLAVALGIARAHDGAITVESEPGRGSVFRVFLPVSGDAVP
jgi:PAS domain S-box-containing protein